MTYIIQSKVKYPNKLASKKGYIEFGGFEIKELDFDLSKDYPRYLMLQGTKDSVSIAQEAAQTLAAAQAVVAQETAKLAEAEKNAEIQKQADDELEAEAKMKAEKEAEANAKMKAEAKAVVAAQKKAQLIAKGKAK